MEEEKKFCCRCKQLIKMKPKGVLGLFSKAPMPYFEFEDGLYCEPCGKVKVKEARGEK